MFISPLVAGVHTADIITLYISAIKALRELDPSMVILQLACQPIRRYLRFDQRHYLYSNSLFKSILVRNVCGTFRLISTFNIEVFHVIIIITS